VLITGNKFSSFNPDYKLYLNQFQSCLKSALVYSSLGSTAVGLTAYYITGKVDWAYQPTRFRRAFGLSILSVGLFGFLTNRQFGECTKQLLTQHNVLGRYSRSLLRKAYPQHPLLKENFEFGDEEFDLSEVDGRNSISGATDTDNTSSGNINNK